MARETDFYNRMVADSALNLILTGGVYQAGVVGLEGISRESTPAAFSGGYLLPCALIRQRGNVPDNAVRDGMAQIVSTMQICEVWLYADSGAGYTAIDAAGARLFVLFEGYALPGAFPTELVNVIDRARDEGSLSGAGLARYDWAVHSILGD